MTPGANRRPEVVVIGGGPAGAVTALALARRGVSVLLLERGDGTGNAIGESLAPSATPLLHRLGLYDAFLASGPLSSHANRSCWGDATPRERDFLREPYGCGWRLDRPAFNAALLETAEAAGALCRRRTPVRRAERHARDWHLVIEDDSGTSTITTEVIVDASGRPSTFARQQGARRRNLDRLVAVVAFLSPTAAPLPDPNILVEATERGWWYSASLPDGRLATAFFSDPDLIAPSRPWHPPNWHALLEHAPQTRHRIDHHALTLTERPRLTAAANACLDQGAGDGWLAVGDAAASFDPLSSHGIGSALAGGHHAAAAVTAYLDGNADALLQAGERTAQSFARFLPLWHAYYCHEQRWPASPFWRRRHEAPRTAAWSPFTATQSGQPT